MKRNLYILIPSLLLGITLTACGTTQSENKNNPAYNFSSSPDTQTSTKDLQTATKPSEQLSQLTISDSTPTKVITNNPNDTSELGTNDYNRNEVSINPKSPYQDFAIVIAHYLSVKFDTTIFKHITIEYVDMYAKSTDPKTLSGEVTLTVEHQPGKSSAYNEGKNIRLASFTHLSDGSFDLSSLSAVLYEYPTANTTAQTNPSALDSPQGIIQTINPIGNQYVMNNAWQKVIGTHFVQVYAGAMEDDLQQGVVVVHDNSLDFSKVDIKEFQTPTKHGSVKIVSSTSNILTLQTSDGTNYWFDADKLNFVSSK